MLDRKTQGNFWYFVAALFLILAIQNFWASTQTTEQLSYSQFKDHLERGDLTDLQVSNQEIRGRFAQPQDGKERFYTRRVDPDIAAYLDKNGVSYSGVAESTWLATLLSWIIPVLFFFALWMFFFRKVISQSGAGGLMQVGKSNAKVYVEKDTRVGFDDVAGVDEAKEELQEIIDFLKSPEDYGKLGAHIPKGVLLVGPPGTGKTLLARAVAGEAGVPFYSISGSEFVEMFVGVGAARVRDLFEQARKKAPAIIFVDELDAVGRARGAGPITGGHDERENTLNQLLSELDGFDPSSGLVLLAATNRPEILDPALLRAGRFDRQILVDRPDRAGRVQILKVHMRKVINDSSVDPEEIAGLTTGFTGADLANLVNEAALLATRRRSENVTLDDYTRAIERIVAGLEKKNRLLNVREREIVAHHEMGHALTSMMLPGADEVHKVSIIPRGVGALGYTIQRPTEDRYLMTRTELENKICVLLGGRAAEYLVFNQLSTGAADDLAKATDIARSMVTRYGMNDDLGAVSYDTEKSRFLGQEAPAYLERRYSEATAERIDQAVKSIIGDLFARTVALLKENRTVLEAGATQLLRQETLETEDLQKLVGSLKT
ncbi:ATP-dependent zinc metalloprotease FtsH [Sneathiella chinensis]|uniref:ATP-dependent zinc metalloprotease FtsH n=1 Tax=Sneathiella chinensis TaxID=349750 RepID=A0ABQ5UA77_9PROT|nr:ATP-dependent zinc metalloprotease FtsH [Sneathiella chinensis]GLQ07451.1 ATP-dependent zinc metalloprotease FtsH [Sneathiella chinensis]